LHAILSDLNAELIRTFASVRDQYLAVLRHLRPLQASDSEATYYRVRDEFNRGGSNSLQAARFIYLNKTSFNGIYRVNRQGRYNVPYGFKPNPTIPGKKDLEAASQALQRATLRSADYEEVLRTAKRGDVVYLDPPYPPLNGTSYFTHYTKERFATADQVRVAQVAASLRSRGCVVVVTNADTSAIRALYKTWAFVEITRPRWISSSCHKHRVTELLFMSD
jgi:DNA adenine methylase